MTGEELAEEARAFAELATEFAPILKSDGNYKPSKSREDNLSDLLECWSEFLDSLPSWSERMAADLVFRRYRVNCIRLPEER